MDRRGLLGGMAGTAMAAPVWAAGAGGANKPDFAVPDGACDCHVHIYDRRFPYKPDAALKPKPGDVADYRRSVQARLRTSRVVCVTPSTYGTDNRCMLDALKQFRGAARGIAVVRPDVPDGELKALHAGGARGVRVNYPREQMLALSRRLAPLGWNMEFFVPGDRLPAMESMLLELPTPIVFDHLGHIGEPDGMTSAGYRTVRKLLDTGRAWMKLSGAYIDSKLGPPDYPDSSAIARSYIAAAPERCLWASNWPMPDVTAGAHPRPRPDALPFFDLFGRWVPDAALRRRILVENPEKLYGFDPAHRPEPI
jgi:predicted TIM-barrel fold metal-dependent hydrolase